METEKQTMQEGPVQAEPETKPTDTQEGPTPPEKPYDEMSPEELLERMKFERDWTLKKQGVDSASVASWKREYGRVSSIAIGDLVYIYRPLFRSEKRELFRMSMSHTDEWRKDLDFTEQIVTRCVMAPKLTLDQVRLKMPDGAVEELAQAIQRLSGHGASMTIVEL